MECILDDSKEGMVSVKIDFAFCTVVTRIRMTVGRAAIIPAAHALVNPGKDERRMMRSKEHFILSGDVG